MGLFRALTQILYLLPLLLALAGCTSGTAFLKNCPPDAPGVLPASLTLLSWNTGYAALGAHADFRTDGGSHWLPSTAGQVRTQANRIADRAASFGAVREGVLPACAADDRDGAGDVAADPADVNEHRQLDLVSEDIDGFLVHGSSIMREQ